MAQTAGQARIEHEERIHVEFLLCIGSRAKKKKKSPFVQRVGGLSWVGEGLSWS